jgi:alpha-1,2-mannosyltransferase
MAAFVALVGLALAAPPFVIGLAALGLPVAGGTIVALGLGGWASWRWHRRLYGLAGVLAASPVLAGLWLVVSLAASVQGVRVSRFMNDVRRADQSAMPWSAFLCKHSCLSAYTEAARLAPTGVNVYDPAVYQDPLGKGDDRERFIGPLVVDRYEYPPPFLLLPRLALVTGADFFIIRRGWFAVQGLLTLAAAWLLAYWIGGRAGMVAALLVPALWLASPNMVTLQIGNFQITAFALSVLAMVAFAGRRRALGGVALGFVTISKIFPGSLGVLLLFQRRWRAALFTAGAAAILTGLALAVLGPRPFLDFFRYQLPRMQSGEALPWIEDPSVALFNCSVYGLVTKLRLLGLPWTGKAAAQHASSVYPILIVGLAFLSARRLNQSEEAGLPRAQVRLRAAQLWLALLTLAALRSPFAPYTYAPFGAVWLLGLLAAEGRHRWWSYGGMAIAAVVFAIERQFPDGPIPKSMVLVPLACQLALLAICVWAVVRPAVARPLPA